MAWLTLVKELYPYLTAVQWYKTSRSIALLRCIGWSKNLFAYSFSWEFHNLYGFYLNRQGLKCSLYCSYCIVPHPHATSRRRQVASKYAVPIEKDFRTLLKPRQVIFAIKNGHWGTYDIVHYQLSGLANRSISVRRRQIGGKQFQTQNCIDKICIWYDQAPWPLKVGRSTIYELLCAFDVIILILRVPSSNIIYISLSS